MYIYINTYKKNIIYISFCYNFELIFFFFLTERNILNISI